MTVMNSLFSYSASAPEGAFQLLVGLTLVSIISASAKPTANYTLPHILLNALQECDTSGPLGMITGEIQDWQISSSSSFPSEWDKGCHERYARVYQPNGVSWCAKYKSPAEWLQVDLGVVSKITGVMTQGRSNGAEWVTSFMVSYSLDAFYWQYVTDLYGNQRVFEGNSDSYSVKHSYLDVPILARFIKFHTIHWNRHPSMRIEVVGCQVCKQALALPPYGRITASSEKIQHQTQPLNPARSPTTSGTSGTTTGASASPSSVSCQAEDAYIVTKKAWCSKDDTANQWLQFDIGPPTLVTGVVTRGRGDGGRKHWVTRFRLSYTNDTSGVWFFYKDANHLDPKDFGGNVDKDIERVHYLNSPFIARYIRFHPMDWHKHISMRAGMIGCPYRGACGEGFMKVNDYTPCVANIAYHKESFVSSKRVQQKRSSAAGRRGQWMHGHASRAVDGDADQNLHSCTILDNFYVDKPVWMVDLGQKTKIAGVIIVTWQGQDDSEARAAKYRDYTLNLDKLVVYVDSKPGGGPETIEDPDKTCGFVSRLNEALFKPRLHVQCARQLYGRYVYIEAWGVANRWSRLFSAVLCEVMVYE